MTTPYMTARVEELLPAYRALVAEVALPLEPLFLANESHHEIAPQVAAARAEVRRRALWAPQLPTSLGGLGLSLAEFAHVSEILGGTLLGHFIANCQAPDAGNMEILIEFGTEAQQQSYLVPLARGEVRSCFSMTEPEFAGSNPTRLGTTAVREGDSYIIDGHKWFTSSADGAAFAIVMAVTNPEAPRHQRASQIIVPLDTPGLTVVRNLPVMGHGGDGHASHAEIRYDGVRVPRSHLLGEEGAGFAIAQQRLGPGRIHHCMRWIGICERAFDLMGRYAARREIAPGRMLADMQSVQHWIAESRAEIDAARLLVLDTARRIDEVGSYGARTQISLIKFYVANVLQRVLDRAIQTHGALGMTDETPLAYWFRHERAARIYDGPDEVHKSAAARRILKAFAP